MITKISRLLVLSSFILTFSLCSWQMGRKVIHYTFYFMGHTQYGYVLLLLPSHSHINFKGHWDIQCSYMSVQKKRQTSWKPTNLSNIWMTEIASQMILAFTFALLWFWSQNNGQQYVRYFHKFFVKYVRHFTKFFKTPQLGSILFVVKMKSLQWPMMPKMFRPQYITILISTNLLSFNLLQPH